MKNDGNIPVIIGVSGHRDLREKDTETLRASVRKGIESVMTKCPHSQIVVMTCLAEGADQLCAETALDMGLEIVTVLPMPAEEYEKDFEGGVLDKFRELVSRSSKVFTAPHLEPFREGRDYLYRQAGIYVADRSHLLMALWDGIPGRPDGCGTAAIVQNKRRNRTNAGDGEQLRHAAGTIMQIMTPRASFDGGDLPAAGPGPGAIIMHGDVSIFEKILRDTDLYNLDCSRLDGVSGDTADAGTEADATDSMLKAVYEASDKLSMINAARHKKTLGWLSVSATVLAMAFLLYDEVDWQGMILLCGVMIIVLFAINAFTDRTRFHARYIEYRILAEMCRVQTYLRTAGSGCEVADIMPWNLQVTVPWIGRAMSAVMTGKDSTDKKSILDIWIIDQKNYHTKALRRTEIQLKRNDRIITVALVLTLLIYLGALIFEIVCCGMFGGKIMFSPEVNEIIRVGIKVAMGTSSAGTLFANNYYGKQVLPNVIDDHRKMMLLYEEAEREIAEKGEIEPLLIRIAEDELGENANWYAYQSKHEPDLGI